MPRRVWVSFDPVNGLIWGAYRTKASAEEDMGCVVALYTLTKAAPHPSMVGCVEITADEDDRSALWRGHGHGYSSLYGDDGEMQCHACPPPAQDYKRAPLAMLVRTALTALALATAAPAKEPTP
jgi:hypothetical protein